MNKITRFTEREEASIITPIIGLKAQGVIYVIIFFGAVFSAALKIPTSNIIFEILITSLIAIPLIGLFGLYAAINYIKSNGPTTITTRGIIYNILYIIGNGVLYTVIYFISKYGASV